VTEAGALWALKEQQQGDVPQTWADVSHANELFGYKPTTSFKAGVSVFYDWWKELSSNE
jgi:UDP-glucuronate 4-epimerase